MSHARVANTNKRQKLLLPTGKGYVVAPKRKNLKQSDIVKSVDVANASKHFELTFDNIGPYSCSYYHNGRYLLIGGRRGHVAALDWVTKDLLCEFNVRESVHAVKWLHVPTMFAVAQKDWVHIYDKDGIELNVVKTMHRVTHLDFLRYHFLLASASDRNYLNWTDITIGKEVANFQSKCKITSITTNPKNALLYCSHPNGTVSMWSPNHKKPALSMLCHGAQVRDIAVSADGNYFATTSVDRTVKIWDLRNDYHCIKEHHLAQIPNSIDFSQLNLLAVSTSKTMNVYKHCLDSGKEITPYLKHNVGSLINGVYFCNFEDVVGIGHQNGFTSLLVPGSGEPNFDSHEANPFMSKSQQKEMEVKMLLDKLPHEMICLNPTDLAKPLNK